MSDVHAETLGRDLHADYQAFDVPLPGSGKRLVKIGNVEIEVPFRRGKDPEVSEVCVATSLDPHADVRRGSKIICHDGCCAAQKGERRLQHSLLTHRNKYWQTSSVIFLEARDWIQPFGCGPPFAVGLEGYAVAQGAPYPATLFG